MAREDTPLDQETFDRVLAEELAKGTDRRVAEGRARSAAVRALRAKSGEGSGPEAAAAGSLAPAGAAAPTPAAPPPDAAAARPQGDGEAAAAAAPPAARPAPVTQPAAAAAAAPSPGGVAVAAPVREAPGPSGNVPSPKKGVQDKHRLLALVPPEGIQRVEREQGDRINVWPHLLIEELVALLVLSAGLVIFSTFVNAPLRELANPNLTPNPS